MRTQDTAARDRAWNQAHPERRLELNRRGNRALYHRKKALRDVIRSVMDAAVKEGF